MGKFTDRIRAAVESTKQVLPVAAGTASGMPPARGGSTASLASLDLTDAACSIREALEAGQPGPAAKMAGTRNRATSYCLVLPLLLLGCSKMSLIVVTSSTRTSLLYRYE